MNSAARTRSIWSAGLRARVSWISILLLLLSAGSEARSVYRADTTAWYDRVQQLQGITVVSAKASDKGDDALRLIRRTITHELGIRNGELGKNGFAGSTTYQSSPTHSKTTLALGPLSLDKLQSGWLAQIPDVYRHIELSPYGGQLILPVVVVADGHAVGLTQLFASGDYLNAVLTDFFADVNIRSPHIRLLQHPFTSPIAPGAPAVYRYHILDTIAGRARVRFAPRRLQDWAFSGELLIDTATAALRAADLTIPRRSDVNYVRRMRIVQAYDTHGRTTDDDMTVELHIGSLVPDMVITRTARHDGTWPELTPGERRLAALVEAMRQRMGGAAGTIAKAFIENWLPLSRAIDLGPIRRIYSHNSHDGTRLSLGLRTTPALCPHLFAEGRYTRALGSDANYYGGVLTWSLSPKRRFQSEAPLRYVAISSERDVRQAGTDTPGDVFAALRWTRQEWLMRYNRQRLSIVREERFGLTTTAEMTTEKIEELGRPLAIAQAAGAPGQSAFRHTTARLALRYAIGEKLVASPVGRRSVSRDKTVLTLSHSFGLGGKAGDVRSSLTRFGIERRHWLSASVCADLRLGLAAEWNEVPPTLLCFPESNQSYFARKGTFNLLKPTEMLADRQAMLSLSIDGGGKLLRCIPIVRHLKWRERIGANILWGRMTRRNAATPTALQAGKPYIELSAGLHNILKLFSIDYTRRLTYCHEPDAQTWGIRAGAEIKF